MISFQTVANNTIIQFKRPPTERSAALAPLTTTSKANIREAAVVALGSLQTSMNESKIMGFVEFSFDGTIRCR